jgi:transposase
LCYNAIVRIDPDNLPTDIPLLHQIIRDLLEEYRRRGTELTKVKDRLSHLLRRVYSKSSERLDEEQLKLFVDELTRQPDDEAAPVDTQPAAQHPEPPAGTEPPPAPKKPRKGHGRNGLPPALPRDTTVSDPPAEQLVCSCGRCLEKIGEETSEQLDYRPAMFRVRRRVRSNWACSRCRSAVVTAPTPVMPIEKGLATAALIAYVIVSKFADHLPLNRLRLIFERHGVPVAPSTMGGWVEAAALLLEPIVLAMRSCALSGRKLHVDATPVPVLDKTRNQTREAQLWVLVGDEQNPFTVFVYCPDKQFGPIAKLLAGFRGFLQADAAPGYDRLFASGAILEVGCRAHARRKIYETLPAGGLAALVPLSYIRQLYDIEKEARNLGLDFEARAKLRQEKAVPILAGLNAWIDEETGRTLPESALGKALAYSVNHRAALDRYVEHGFLEIDNNPAERQLRRIAVGRANWTFAGSDRGGRAAATLYSLVATCQRHGVEPWAYLADVLERVSTHPASRVEELFPQNWAEARRHDVEVAHSPPETAQPEITYEAQL